MDCLLYGGRRNPSETFRCGSLLPSPSADVRSSDDVIAFKGHRTNLDLGTLPLRRKLLQPLRLPPRKNRNDRMKARRRIGARTVLAAVLDGATCLATAEALATAVAAVVAAAVQARRALTPRQLQ